MNGNNKLVYKFKLLLHTQLKLKNNNNDIIKTHNNNNNMNIYENKPIDQLKVSSLGNRGQLP